MDSTEFKTLIAALDDITEAIVNQGDKLDDIADAIREHTEAVKALDEAKRNKRWTAGPSTVQVPDSSELAADLKRGR